MEGRTVLITGATDGLGRALAADLAGRGARVLVHGRDPGRVSAAVAETGAAGGYVADLASLAEVRRLAADVARDHEELHVLVSNAGIGTTLPGDGERMESADGYELRFAVNHLAGFLRGGRRRDRPPRGRPGRRRRDRPLLQPHAGGARRRAGLRPGGAAAAVGAERAPDGTSLVAGPITMAPWPM